MDREIKAQGHEVNRLNDHIRVVIRENEDMATRLEV
jgi:chromosome segregation ATPase